MLAWNDENLELQMIIVEAFNLIFFGPIINILVLIYQGLNTINIPGALGFSIIALTLVIRLLVWPFMASQIKMTKKMADLKPHLDELKSKHRDDKKALASAQMALYKEHGVNPAGGCLPALIQIPIFIALYQAILNIIPNAGGNLDTINRLIYFPQLKLSQAIDPNFFGINLGTKPSEFGSLGVGFLLIPIITAALTFVQSKMMAPKRIKKYPSDSPTEKKEKEGLEDSMGQMQSQMAYLMPVMIGYFAFTFPVGLAIYWNTYTILGIVQQYQHTGWGGLADFVGKFQKTSTK